MAEPSLDSSAVVAFVGKPVAAGVAQHMGARSISGAPVPYMATRPGTAARDRRLRQPFSLTYRPNASRSFRNGGEGMHDQRGAWRERIKPVAVLAPV